MDQKHKWVPRHKLAFVACAATNPYFLKQPFLFVVLKGVYPPLNIENGAARKVSLDTEIDGECGNSFQAI